MFTGIIEETGIVKSVVRSTGSAAITVKAHKVLEETRRGDSINTNGVCLTVTSNDSSSFTVDVSTETLQKTNLGQLKPGDRVNLERALRLSDRLGGHIVSGHIDDTGRITQVRKESNTTWITVTTAPQWFRYIVGKGSVAVDGISLTVASVGNEAFTVAVIPLTETETTLSGKKAGDTVNIECDVIGKYVERLLQKEKKSYPESNLDENYLKEHGFID